MAAGPDGGEKRAFGTRVAAGLGASFAVARLIASQLWGVSPHDPSTLIGGIVVLVLSGIAACYVPTQKATAVDPIIAIKVE